MNGIETNNLMNEYNTIRVELLGISKSIKQLNLTTISITAATVLFTFQFEILLLSLFGFLFALVSLFYVKSQKNSIQNMSIYIEVFIESRIDELNWNTLRGSVAKTTWLSKIGIESIELFYFFILFICAFTFNLSSFIEGVFNNKRIIISSFIFLIIGVLAFIFIIKLNRCFSPLESRTEL